MLAGFGFFLYPDSQNIILSLQNLFGGIKKNSARARLPGTGSRYQVCDIHANILLSRLHTQL